MSEPTNREVEVLDYIVQGKRDREIAEALGVSLRTVKTHVRNLLLKSGLQNRVALAVWWLARELHREGAQLERERKDIRL